MKKLILLATVLCVATISQAASASWNWKTSGTPAANQVIYDLSSSSTLYSTTPAAAIYLFDAAVVSQDALLAKLRDNTYANLGAATSIKNTGITSESKMTAVSDFVYGESGTTYDFYMAIIDTAGNVFLSANKSVLAQESATVDITFSNPKTSSVKDWTADATSTFAANGAGWYAVVPEPTSGLMLLLGIGLMALKRKQA